MCRFSLSLPVLHPDAASCTRSLSTQAWVKVPQYTTTVEHSESSPWARFEKATSRPRGGTEPTQHSYSGSFYYRERIDAPLTCAAAKEHSIGDRASAATELHRPPRNDEAEAASRRRPSLLPTALLASGTYALADGNPGHRGAHRSLVQSPCLCRLAPFLMLQIYEATRTGIESATTIPSLVLFRT